jgi:hypothetical protein
LNKTDLKTTKKLRDSLNSVSAKLNDANYFSLEKMKMHKIILNRQEVKNNSI